ncbi:MAG: hypothetical protein A2655_00670 [Candidatus Yanofskybacteria bacterium RIFCSPHIGHO2_01_FULL_43_42]|uniref:Uncharacterized protein n=1 Tax=Candidatus Yanofskybacteria bacterium RIFCSPLOWO2_01_FULL_43_22 TaxID=1802695 RepID=A0A1F8GFX1_9BACT|nr:MAG: hypothetical protein A2655_00670 [Candidatus Yanofskybacteria bacterium RIFCSPHIGHO2_01_FULL_43_42]OGN13768.1 MAG: hypothetical protein A3D48_00420 [Candidatus Yanofskybacteria bacterium RIFCSPHIGHO2_02_FULL_43_17]OGN24287.1 MAG: hypothetical protein A3A13_03870 [Candidatus Yanofskybacteria bacterium RIFCSPLOWO2_01_FULL_43_22]
MTFKPKQLDPEAVKVFSETEVGTLLENIDGKLDLILEGQNGICEDIRVVKSGYQSLDKRVAKTEARLDVVEAR